MQLKRHDFRELVNELRAVPSIGCKRELIVGVLHKYGIFPEPVNLGKRTLLAVLEVDRDNFAHLDAESGILKAYCHFAGVGPGWYFDGGSFLSPEQFAALDPAKYYVKEPRHASAGLPEEVSDASTVG